MGYYVHRGLDRDRSRCSEGRSTVQMKARQGKVSLSGEDDSYTRQAKSRAQKVGFCAVARAYPKREHQQRPGGGCSLGWMKSPRCIACPQEGQ